MDRILRNRAFSLTLLGIAETLQHLDKTSIYGRDFRILERTIWDLKQAARIIRGSAMTTKLSGSTEPRRARLSNNYNRSPNESLEQFLAGDTMTTRHQSDAPITTACATAEVAAHAVHN